MDRPCYYTRRIQARGDCLFMKTKDGGTREGEAVRRDKLDGYFYNPGAFQAEAEAFFRRCVGEETFALAMSREAGQKHPYVAARVFLNQSDWEKYVWIEQHGSLDDYSEVLP